jgi:hypothetical protein
MTHAVSEQPYGTKPGATKNDVQRYHRNFAKAQSERKDRRTRSDPAEELIIDRLSTYLWSNFDARPYDQIKADITLIVEGQLRHA